ncbi:MAG: pyridoxamine 5'-phosphate oxidase family protein [Halobacteriaceae archaeon]
MALDEETELTDEEIDNFLSRQETGVLSLARENKPYSIPISYGYDSTNRLFYLRLVSNPESEKRKFLSTSPKSRLVIYSSESETYYSVIAVGTLNEVTEDQLTSEHIEQYGEAKRPLFEIWGMSKEELNVLLYQLDPDEINGRQVTVNR